MNLQSLPLFLKPITLFTLTLALTFLLTSFLHQQNPQSPLSPNPNPNPMARSFILWLHGLGDSGPANEPIRTLFTSPEFNNTKWLFPSAPHSPVSCNYLGRQYLMSKMENNPDEFRRIYRMYTDCFTRLCILLRERRQIQDTRYISVEEMTAIFLLIVSQNQRYSVSCERFDRSRFAVSICFNKAMQTLVDLSPTMLASPPTDKPNEIMSNPRFLAYFKDCIGAIDGTHIPCMVYGDDQSPYRNRHGELSQNILAACTFDLRFIYVLAGWEGSANDSRVLTDAMSRAHRLPLPNNKFYLVNCGYLNRLQFVALYRGIRYHLQEFGNSRVRPQN